MSDVEESAKAVAEVAKLGTASVDAGVKLGSFFVKVLGEPFQDAVGLLGDRLRLYRFQNQVVIMDKVDKILNEREVSNTRPIPPKFAIPIMEYASLEEDENLQDIWCKLLANGLDPNRDIEFKYCYIEIIKSITPLDASILRFIYEQTKGIAEVKFLDTGEPLPFDECTISLRSIIVYFSSIPPQMINVSLCNLMRVQCIEEATLREKVMALKSRLESKVYIKNISRAMGYYIVTSLGADFIRSCMED